MDKIVLVGAGGHARSCIDVIEQERQYTVAAVIGKEPAKDKGKITYPLYTDDSCLKLVRKDVEYGLVTVGQIKTADVRFRLFQNLCDLGYKLPVIRSPLAYVSDSAEVGCGTIVMHTAMVNAGARVGTNVIINSRALIEHDAIVADHCHISTGAIINGGAIIGDGVFIGSGSVIREGVSIGDHCFIGANCFVEKTVESGTVLKC